MLQIMQQCVLWACRAAFIPGFCNIHLGFMKNTSKIIGLLKRSLEFEPEILPVFSAIALQVQLELIKNQPDLKVIEQLILQDQSLSSTVLRIANSVRYCGLIETTTIRSAIVRLGMAEIMQIVCAEIGRKMFHSHDHVIEMLMKKLWQHSVGCAFTAGMLAPYSPHGVLQAEAFSAGLFHDIGKLHILKIIETKRKTNKIFDVSAETIQEIFTELHAKQGYWLINRLKLPKMYALVARDHHLPECDTNDTLLLLVRLANAFCHHLGLGMTADPAINILESSEAQALPVTEIHLEKIRKFLASNPNLFG